MNDRHEQQTQAEQAAETLSLLSLCFAPVEGEVWKDASKGDTWTKAMRAGAAYAGEQASFEALLAPPDYSHRQAFFNEHFVGGLSHAVLPVESLYRPWTVYGETPFGQTSGLYGGDSARYMSELANKMGLTIPAQFAACPDHLSLELDLLALLLQAGMNREAATFAAERFDWVGAFREKLENCDGAGFFLAAAGLAQGIARAQAHRFEIHRTPCTAGQTACAEGAR